MPSAAAAMPVLSAAVAAINSAADRVVVFTARPGRVKTIVPIDMPRPRDPFSASSEALRKELTDILRDEVDRAFAEQEALAVPA